MDIGTIVMLSVLFSCIGGGYFLGLDHRIGHPMPFRSTPRLAAAD